MMTATTLMIIVIFNDYYNDGNDDDDGDNNELTHFLIQDFETVPNLKKLQTTTEMWLLIGF